MPALRRKGSHKRAQARQRLRYSDKSRARFVELSDAFLISGKELFQSLKQVQGASDVVWRRSNAEQSNPSDGRDIQRNILARSSLVGLARANKPMEFDIIRHQHVKRPNVPLTVTAMFKEPPAGMHEEAWRILREVVKGKQLYPDQVQRRRHALSATSSPRWMLRASVRILRSLPPARRSRLQMRAVRPNCSRCTCNCV